MVQLTKIPYPSQNYNDRPSNVTPSIIVMHYTGMQYLQEALDRLCCTKAQVSAHYLVAKNGDIFQLVDEDKRAWHAGISHWRGLDNINDHSIGIEIENGGHEWGYTHFPDAQMDSIIRLSQDIVGRYGILPHNIVGHSDIAPDRKEDPGELFNWQLLADNGIGICPKIKGIEKQETGISAATIKNISHTQKKLQQYGYKINITNKEDEQTHKVIIAFQRHFRQDNINGIWDTECETILNYLIRKTK